MIAVRTLNEYQRLAATTEFTVYISRNNLTPIPRLLYNAGAMSGEAGEVFNKVKKVFRDDGGEITKTRREQIIKELGGTLWYLAMTADALGITLEDVASSNLTELNSRAKRNVLHGDGDNR